MITVREKLHKNTKKGVRIVASILLLVFVFSWGFLKINPFQMTRYLLAEIGTEVVIPENEYNMLAQQLEERSAELDERERLIGGALQERRDEERYMTMITLGLITVLFALLLTNFYFDYGYRREKLERGNKKEN